MYAFNGWTFFLKKWTFMACKLHVNEAVKNKQTTNISNGSFSKKQVGNEARVDSLVCFFLCGRVREHTLLLWELQGKSGTVLSLSCILKLFETHACYFNKKSLCLYTSQPWPFVQIFVIMFMTFLLVWPTTGSLLKHPISAIPSIFISPYSKTLEIFLIFFFFHFFRSNFLSCHIISFKNILSLSYNIILKLFFKYVTFYSLVFILVRRGNFSKF